VLRIVLRLKNGKCTQDEFDAFLKLNTHAQADRKDIVLAAKAVKEYSGTDMDEDLIASFFTRVRFFSLFLTPF
jgi:hypothetical protein